MWIALVTMLSIISHPTGAVLPMMAMSQIAMAPLDDERPLLSKPACETWVKAKQENCAALTEVVTAYTVGATNTQIIGIECQLGPRKTA